MIRVITFGIAVSAASVVIAATDKQTPLDMMVVHEAPAVKCERYDGKTIMAAVAYCKDIGGRVTEWAPQEEVKPMAEKNKR